MSGDIEKMRREIAELRKKNKRYKTALAFYADKLNYGHDAEIRNADGTLDVGEKARIALKDEEKQNA